MKNYHDDIDFKKIGARIREARKAANLTQEKAAEHSLISGQFFSRIESGRERGSVNTYLRIAAILGRKLDDIFYDDVISMRLLKGFSNEGILADCSKSEKAIISEITFALKESLKRNRRS